MRHHVFSAAIGVVLGAAFVSSSATEAAAADPTGYWQKAEQGERPGKMQLYRCGSAKRYLCAKIVWLQDPLDSRGRPLRDVRNENPGLRGRQIIGLPIINGMAPVGANRWKGNIYNPEDGNTYSATLTLVSRNKIHLKGCKAWLLCGERTWVRTSLPQQEPTPEPTTQVEASAKPTTEPGSARTALTAAPQATDPFADTEMMTPSARQSVQAGYRFLNASTQGHGGLNGDNVSSMFKMTTPLKSDADRYAPVPAAAEPAAPASQPQSVAQPPAQPKPAARPQAIQANVVPAPSTDQAAVDPATEGAELLPPETAEAGEAVDRRKLSWRERRQLRRQQRAQEQQGDGLIPWLR